MNDGRTCADPMVVAVGEEQVADLRARLAATRWPDEIDGSDWDYGTSLAYMRELIAYWQTEYDWREHERAMNSLAAFRVRIERLGVHFIHERGRGPDALPLVLTHGWSSSFLEMVKVIPRDLPGGRAVNELEVVASEPPREFAIRTTAGPTPFLYRYRLSAENGGTDMRLDAEVELPGAAAFLPQLARRLVKKSVNDNLATLKQILEAARP